MTILNTILFASLVSHCEEEMGDTGGGGGRGGGGGAGRGGSCTQKCTTCTYDHATLDRIMVRFRPIAPKPPVVGGPDYRPQNNNSNLFAKTRAKRKYIRLNKCRNKRGVVSEEKGSCSDGSEGRQKVTLSLLPETPGSARATATAKATPSSTDLDLTVKTVSARSNRTVEKQHPQQTVRSYVGSVAVLERVEGLGSNDVERMMDLENNTCPGFISNGYNSVWWTNRAYRSMVGSEMVSLVMKDRLPLISTAFVCRVRLQYTCRNVRKSMIVPCDVWRMESGDFAWRLDVQAALSLGR